MITLPPRGSSASSRPTQPPLFARLGAALRTRIREASHDLQEMPDRLRADIGLRPLGDRRPRIIPPIGFHRF